MKLNSIYVQNEGLYKRLMNDYMTKPPVLEKKSDTLKRRFGLFEKVSESQVFDNGSTKSAKGYFDDFFSKVNDCIKFTVKRANLEKMNYFLEFGDRDYKIDKEYVISRSKSKNCRNHQHLFLAEKKKQTVLNQFKSADNLKFNNINIKKTGSKDKQTFGTYRNFKKFEHKKMSLSNVKNIKNTQNIIKLRKKLLLRKNSDKKDGISKRNTKLVQKNIQAKNFKNKFSQKKTKHKKQKSEAIHLYREQLQENSVVKINDSLEIKKPLKVEKPKNFKRCKSNELVIQKIGSSNNLVNEGIYKHKKTFSSGIEKNVIIEELFLNDSSSNLGVDSQNLYVK